jgi:hypothetical protein
MIATKQGQINFRSKREGTLVDAAIVSPWILLVYNVYGVVEPRNAPQRQDAARSFTSFRRDKRTIALNAHNKDLKK